MAMRLVGFALVSFLVICGSSSSPKTPEMKKDLQETVKGGHAPPSKDDIEKMEDDVLPYYEDDAREPLNMSKISKDTKEVMMI